MKPHYLNDFVTNKFMEQGEKANWKVKTNPYEGGSDHVPFLRADIPGVLFWHFTDQFYHTDNDRIDKVSQETLKNVGTAALASAFVLLNSNENTALDVLETIKTAAQLRMEAEYDLSLENLANGGKKADETKILKAWEDWYLKTMQTVSDMDMGTSENLMAKIKEAQMNLILLTKSQIKKL